MNVGIRAHRFLVELWAEPRGAALVPVVRGRLMALHIDHSHSDHPEWEVSVGSLPEIMGVLDAHLDAAGLVPRRREREP